ncbi:hypothetical protein [Yanghanlia caeni]|uniref:Uncharacterized protein n=1 Tax=Yanghanlia caeni TaxID=3064283 RepID=A0ABU1D3T1_9BURK|nr:hypothetical protein [Alcaligenaceae bacterium LG-2]
MKKTDIIVDKHRMPCLVGWTLDKRLSELAVSLGICYPVRVKTQPERPARDASRNIDL